MLRYCFYFLSLLAIVCVYFIYIQQSVDDNKQNTTLTFSKKLNNSSCILSNVIKRREDNPDRITLILHASSDRIDERIVEQVENWNAPVSLAIAFYDKDMIQSIGCISSFLKDLKNQSSAIDQFLSVHFLIDNSAITNCAILALKTVEPCFEPTKDTNLTAFEISTKLIKYPINKARNIGRKHASTKYILVADLGHYFSLNFEKKMRILSNSILEKHPKTALVYRIFETKYNATQPKTKTDLKNMMESDEAFEFHHTSNDHSIEHLNEWFESPESDTESFPSIQFFKEYDSPKWEPQFVSKSDIPLFDIGFRYPRRDNTVLRWEMCRAGYKFAIINDIFAYHKGLKSYNEMNFLNKVRRRLTKSMEETLGRFLDRMDLEYPKTKYKCPILTSKSNI